MEKIEKKQFVLSIEESDERTTKNEGKFEICGNHVRVEREKRL